MSLALLRIGGTSAVVGEASRRSIRTTSTKEYKLKQPIFSREDTLIIQDGIFTTIRIGNRNWETIYSRTGLSSKLKDLEGVAHLLLKLNKQLSMDKEQQPTRCVFAIYRRKGPGLRVVFQ